MNFLLTPLAGVEETPMVGSPLPAIRSSFFTLPILDEKPVTVLIQARFAF
jgi:hypothetical protein